MMIDARFLKCIGSHFTLSRAGSTFFGYSFLISCCLFCLNSFGQLVPSKIHINDLNVRDPFIVADKQSKTYFLYKSSSTKDKKGNTVSSLVTYKSKDLKIW